MSLVSVYTNQFDFYSIHFDCVIHRIQYNRGFAVRYISTKHKSTLIFENAPE